MGRSAPRRRPSERRGIGRVDARLPTVVSASYANDDGHEHHAVDCAVEPGRAGEAVRCNTVAGTGGGYVWTLRVDGYAAVLDDMPRMRYEAASIDRIKGVGANVHSGSTQGGDTVCVGARRVPPRTGPEGWEPVGLAAIFSFKACCRAGTDS